MSTDRIPKVGEVWTHSSGEAFECRHVEPIGALWRAASSGWYDFYGIAYVQEYWTPPSKPPMPEPVHTELWVTPDGLLVISPSRDRVAKFRIVHTADGQGYEIVDFEDLR